jgi:hypothetical protein
LRRRLAAALALLLAAAPAQATAQSHMDKALFLELAAERDSESWGLLLVHLKGVLAGLEAANMQLTRRGDARLYCPPPDAVLTPDWAAGALESYLARYPDIPPNMSIAVIATFMLADAYPCETPARR